VPLHQVSVRHENPSVPDAKKETQMKLTPQEKKALRSLIKELQGFSKELEMQSQNIQEYQDGIFNCVDPVYDEVINVLNACNVQQYVLEGVINKLERKAK
jgi:hypothetical protein